MSLRKILFSAAFLIVAAAGGNADAAYSYVTTISPGSITFDGGSPPPPSVITFTGRSDSGIPGNTQINAADIHLTSNAADLTPDTLPPTNFTITITITNNAVVGSLSFTESITGFASLNQSQLDTTLISNPGSIPINIGGSLFSINVGPIGAQDFLFSPPTVNGPDGSQGARIIVTPSVPEPASIAMLGLGLISFGGFALRRRMAK